MSTAIQLFCSSQSCEPVNTHPSAALFDFVEKRFGRSCARIRVKRNSILCVQGTRLTNFSLIKQGEILLTRLSPDGCETLISVLGPGGFFGESSLIGKTEVAFSARATRRSELLQLSVSQFKLLLENPRACHILLAAVSRRCDDAWTQVEVLGCTHVRNKVRSGLIWLSETMGVETCEGVRIDLNQTQLARMVGCARETLSREVSALRRLNAVDVKHSNGRKSLYVVNPEKLVPC